MKLTDLFESKFRADVRFRGAAYLEAERVSLIRVTAEQVFGIVQENGEFETQLSRENSELKMFCTCEPFQRAGSCKHLWATMLAVENEGLLTGPARPGNVPPFAEEVRPNLFDDDEDWGDEPDFVPGPRPTANKVNGSDSDDEEPPAARMRPWEATLHSLRHKMESSEPPAPSAGREREIFYEIDIDQSRSVRQLVIQTSQRQRRANGQWGKLKPLKLRSGQLDEIEHEDDRTILAYLSGGTPERGDWHAQQTEIQATVSRYRIPFELSELILPLMCATRRVRYQTARQTDAEPLTWDDGEPWELLLQVQCEEDETWMLRGGLQREDTTLSVGDVVLLIPGGLVLTDTHIARLRDFDAFSWVDLVTADKPVEVPSGEEQELVDSLLDMPSLPRLDLPPELRLEEVTCEPARQLTIRFPSGKRWQRERLQGDVAFDYLGSSVPGSSAQWAIVQREEKRCVLRNGDSEEQAWTQLQEQGFRRLLGHQQDHHDVEIEARSLAPAVRTLIESGWRIQADGKEVRQAGPIKFQVRTGIDWFELHGDVDFGGAGISFPQLLAALVRGDQTIRLDDGSYGVIPEEWAKQFGLLAGLGTADEEALKFSHHQVALLDALLAAQEHVEFDEKFTDLRDRFTSFTGVSSAEEPKGFEGTLRPYQRDGLGWLSFLSEFRLGGCLADDMGLGKTVQVLALLAEHRNVNEKRNPSLVVVPKSLLFNWHHECNRFAPQLDVLEYTGLERAGLREEFQKFDVILTTYGTLRRDIISLKDTAFDYVVLDEAQTIKNSASQVAKASRLLQATHRIALSGTPIENHLGDLWSIFEFLNPGLLGRSSLFKQYASDAKDENARRLLSQGLQPFILRRTKREVAGDLPEKSEETIYCDMGEEQQKLYNELRDHYRSSLLGMVSEQGLGKSKMHVLEALLRLRQAACHPGLLDKGDIDNPSAKLDVLIPHLEELIEEGHKALVFSQFTSMLAIARKHLDAKGMEYEYLDGKTRDRKERVERFQTDDKCGLFLISLKAGGLGLNLTAADYVYLLDPWWNPAVETQAIDRAHRVGQTRQVFAYRMICRGTVEEKIAELQSKKRELADAILHAEGGMLKEMSREDLELLLS